MLALFDAFFVLHPDLSPHRAGVESAFLGLARTIKQRGKIFVAGKNNSPIVSRLMNAPFRALPALRLVPEIDARRQIMALGARYADGIWVVGFSEHLVEALQAARENFFNTVALVENPPDSLRPSCDALVECEDVRLIDAVCDALSGYFSIESAFASVPVPREEFETGGFADDFDDANYFADEDDEVEIVEVDAIAAAVMQWESDWKDARNVERGGPSRAETEAQGEAFLNRDWAQVTGVDHWSDNHSSLLARGDVESVGAIIVSLCNAAQWDKNTLDETITLGKSGYFLYQIAGQKWTSALWYQAADSRLFDLKFRGDLAEQLSLQLGAAFHLGYSDTVCCLDYALWQDGQILESNQTAFGEDEAADIFNSRLAPELVGQKFDAFERCETVMREWRIYAPTLEAAYFTPFNDILDLQNKAGTQFEPQNGSWTCYFGSNLARVTLPIERFDHIILAL